MCGGVRDRGPRPASDTAIVLSDLGAIPDLLDVAATRAILAKISPEIVLHLAARTDLDEKRDISGYRDNIEAVESLQRRHPKHDICPVAGFVLRRNLLFVASATLPSTTLTSHPQLYTARARCVPSQIVRCGGPSAVPWTLVRPTTIWGPGMHPHYLRAFEMIRDGRYFHVGPPTTRKSFGYVGNAVAQFLAIATAPLDAVRGRTFYMSDYEAINFQEWVEGFRAELHAPRIA